MAGLFKKRGPSGRVAPQTRRTLTVGIAAAGVGVAAAVLSLVQAPWILVSFGGFLVAAWLFRVRWEPILAAGLATLAAAGAVLLFRRQGLSDTLAVIAYALMAFGCALGLIEVLHRGEEPSSEYGAEDEAGTTAPSDSEKPSSRAKK